MIETIVADLHNDAHAKDFMKVLSSYAEDPMGGGGPLSDYTQSNLVEALKQQSQNFIVMCYVDGDIAGISNCFYGFSSFKAKPLINIHDFAILPQYRGRGLSKHLLNKVEGIAKENGCCKITLEVLENNQRAKKVYEAFGFEGYELNPEMGRAIFWQKNLK